MLLTGVLIGCCGVGVVLLQLLCVWATAVIPCALGVLICAALYLKAVLQRTCRACAVLETANWLS